MSATARTPADACQRLARRDATLSAINVARRQLADADVAELVDCLLAHPDVVTGVYLSDNLLTDAAGVKLADYLAASTTVQGLSLAGNLLGDATYLAVAAALRVNTSLQVLFLYDNQPQLPARIDDAFAHALRLNPNRPAASHWLLYTPDTSATDDHGDSSSVDDFHRLRAADVVDHAQTPLVDQLAAARRLVERLQLELDQERQRNQQLQARIDQLERAASE